MRASPPWLWAALGALALFVILRGPFGISGIGTSWGWPQDARNRAQEAIRAAELGADTLARSNAILAHRSDSLAGAVRAAEVRADRYRIDAAGDLARAAYHAAQMRDSLAGALDMESAALLADYVAARDSADMIRDSIIATQDNEISALRAERTALYATVAGVRAELVAEHNITLATRAAHEALVREVTVRAERDRVVHGIVLVGVGAIVALRVFAP